MASARVRVTFSPWVLRRTAGQDASAVAQASPGRRTEGQGMGEGVGKVLRIVLGRLRRLARRATTPLGRHKIATDLLLRAALLLRPAAGVYRRTLVRRVRLVAVVGSLGKSTTTAAVAAALGLPVGPPLPTNHWTGVALRVLRVRPWQQDAVVEVGITRRGQMIRHARLVRPDVAVVTGIASEHRRSLGPPEAAAREKALILRGLGPGGLAVLNGDDPWVRAMAAWTEARVVTFGLGAGNDVRATEVRLDWPHGTRLRVHVGGEVRTLRVRLLGRVMVHPVLAAVAVAWAAGRPWGEVARALEALEPRPGRLQPVPLPGGAWLIRDDLKATLETIDAALDVLAEVPGRRIVVLGEIDEPPGSQGPHYRRLGARLAAVASRAVIVGGRRSCKSYAGGAAAAGMRGTLVRAGRSTRTAVQTVLPELAPGDVVLVKGRATQRFERVALALEGRPVRCDIAFCNLMRRCATCPALEAGWTADPGMVVGPSPPPRRLNSAGG
jgi:UDP-N-acetylmuramoyl-tripeptide--D-alanyl-D-alanine ligase